MKKLIGVLGFLVLLNGSNVAANSFNMSADHIANKVFNDLYNQGKFSNLDQNSLDEVRQNLQEDISKKLELVKTGELSLDPNAPNYFLIGSIIDFGKSLVQKAIQVGKSLFNSLKGALGTVIDAGLGFLGMVDNDFVKSVISGAATALSKLGPLVGDFISFVPGIGPIISMIIDTVTPFADIVVNSATLDMVTGAISTAANAIGITKDAISSLTTKASLAPSTESIFDSMSASGSSEASATDKKKAIGGLTTLCQKTMGYLAGLSADAYNKLPEKAKLAASQCNQLAAEANKKLSN